MVIYCRSWLGLLLAAVTFIFASSASAEVVVHDALGREVKLRNAAQRIVVNDSLILYSLALIDPDPVSRLAGWGTPGRIDGGVYAAFRKRFPEIDAIPDIGGVVAGKISVEAIIGMKPDVFIVGLWQAGWDVLVEQLAAADIPVIFLDGPRVDKLSPPDATAFSVRLLGQIIGKESKAREYAAFVKARYSRVDERLSDLTKPKSVLIDVQAGSLCCYTAGASNRMTQYLELAGGHSIGADAASGYDTRINIEYVLGADPDIYIATGMPRLADRGGMAMGGGISAGTAISSLRAVTNRNHLDSLTAVQKGKVFAVSHQIAISALNIIVFECFAKWLHPDEMSDIDPEMTLAEINQHFFAVPLEGTFWIAP